MIFVDLPYFVCFVSVLVFQASLSKCSLGRCSSALDNEGHLRIKSVTFLLLISLGFEVLAFVQEVLECVWFARAVFVDRTLFDSDGVKVVVRPQAPLKMRAGIFLARFLLCFSSLPLDSYLKHHHT